MIKFAHTNIVANDWKKLAQFYQVVFDCEPVYPQRNLSGKWLENATSLKNAHIQGIHLRLPGHGDSGPTLEIFQYKKNSDTQKKINSVGFSHIAFLVDDLDKVLNKFIENGGSKLGEIVEKEIPNAGTINFIYAKDPEENIVEIQHWK